MCGIIGIASSKDIIQPLVEGLRKLAYRGYDSAGLATLDNGRIVQRRAIGKIDNLERLIKKKPVSGSLGIAHTRWATHGIPNEANAHPHSTGEVAIVHNGIIENYKDLIKKLDNKVKLKSQTDSEVIAHLITYYLHAGYDEYGATRKTLEELKGAFALGILFNNTNKILAFKKGSPLAVGYGEKQNYIGSDAIGLAPFTKKISYLEDNDWAIIEKDSVKISNNNHLVERAVNTTNVSRNEIEKGGYKHFMHKEIHEQPTVIGETLKSLINLEEKSINFDSKILNSEIKRITLIACGTSAFACRIAKFWFEELSKVQILVDIASEFRYRTILSEKDEVAFFISQSGETRDTIACIEAAKENNLKTVSIVNVLDSTISRLSDENIFTLAGPEIGVASTKAFTTQLLTLLIISILLAKKKKLMSAAIEKQIVGYLLEIPSLMKKILEKENYIRDVAASIYNSKDILYIGRGISHGIALEGALKLKEISYIHAEGYAAGELKHGPIALIDKNMPVIGIIPSNELFEKTLSNLSEVHARGGKIVCITDKKGEKMVRDISYKVIVVPESAGICHPMLYALPVQLLAYHIAALKGTDVDQPRNLAKSVTVE